MHYSKNTGDPALDILMNQLNIHKSTATDDEKMGRVLFMLKSSDRYKSIRTAIANEKWSETPSPEGISFMIPYTDKYVTSDPFADLEKIDFETSAPPTDENSALKPKNLKHRRRVSFSDDLKIIEDSNESLSKGNRFLRKISSVFMNKK